MSLLSTSPRPRSHRPRRGRFFQGARGPGVRWCRYGAAHQPGDPRRHRPRPGPGVLRGARLGRRATARRRDLLLPGRRDGVRPLDGARRPRRARPRARPQRPLAGGGRRRAGRGPARGRHDRPPGGADVVGRDVRRVRRPRRLRVGGRPQPRLDAGRGGFGPHLTGGAGSVIIGGWEVPVPPDDVERAAQLLERLLVDRDFRADFRRDPAGRCRDFDLDEVAAELAGGGAGGFQTLEVRESRSSLAGVLLAAAVEGISAVELMDVASASPGGGSFGHGAGGGGGEAKQALQLAVSRTQALPAAPAPAAPPPPLEPELGHGHLHAAAAPASHGRCPVCGDAAPLGAPVCEHCLAEGRLPGAGAGAGAGGRLGLAAGGDQALGLAGPASGGPGAPSVAPVDPANMAGSNAAGRLHGSEYAVVDAEGAPGGPGGASIHAGYDLFGAENAPIRSPVDGEIVEVRASRGTSGQVFGGTVKVQAEDGHVWVFRHTTPGDLTVGERVAAGTQIARISPWADGAEHTHIEVWKSLSGGYNAANMEDPYQYLQRLYGGAGAPVPP